MSDVLETVLIATEAGSLVINKSDFDADTMELFEATDVSDDDKDADEMFAEAIANIDNMKKEALVEALEAMEADSEGKVPELKERLVAVMTEAYNNGEPE